MQIDSISLDILIVNISKPILNLNSSHFISNYIFNIHLKHHLYIVLLNPRFQILRYPFTIRIGSHNAWLSFQSDTNFHISEYNNDFATLLIVRDGVTIVAQPKHSRYETYTITLILVIHLKTSLTTILAKQNLFIAYVKVSLISHSFILQLFYFTIATTLKSTDYYLMTMFCYFWDIMK